MCFKSNAFTLVYKGATQSCSWRFRGRNWICYEGIRESFVIRDKVAAMHCDLKMRKLLSSSDVISLLTLLFILKMNHKQKCFIFKTWRFLKDHRVEILWDSKVFITVMNPFLNQTKDTSCPLLLFRNKK